MCGALWSIRFSRLKYISEAEGRGWRGCKFNDRRSRDGETTKASAALNLVGEESIMSIVYLRRQGRKYRVCRLTGNRDSSWDLRGHGKELGESYSGAKTLQEVGRRM